MTFIEIACLCVGNVEEPAQLWLCLTFLSSVSYDERRFFDATLKMAAEYRIVESFILHTFNWLESREQMYNQQREGLKSTTRT